MDYFRNFDSMEIPESSFPLDKQNNQLALHLVTPTFGHLLDDLVNTYSLTHRKTYYFFLLMLEGAAHHRVDLRDYHIGNHELLFVLPHQIHQLPPKNEAIHYFKIGFDESCLARLPKQYPFLINPFNRQKIAFAKSVLRRLQSIFEILLDLLKVPNTDPELILAHLNSLLTEINAAYFADDKKPADDRLATFIGFKVFVENNLTHHPSISDIAQELAVSTDSLYQIVKQYSGLSPKEFVTNRLILEARRRLYYGERSSVKELAFELGFNDPDYFSRLFKKVTGKTVANFSQDLS
jgi:AraC family transcriptional activator of pobA